MSEFRNGISRGKGDAWVGYWTTKSSNVTGVGKSRIRCRRTGTCCLGWPRQIVLGFKVTCWFATTGRPDGETHTMEERR
jgi:hypothetical protein